ncbi:MAG: hypothetical protein KDK90_00080 [Leptospiraceae bacterium]|nr:hypothetical protein [Leptospiraceae bacterium]
MKLKFRLIVYVLAIIALCLLRLELDKGDVFITSDGQIKFYQAIQYKHNGLLSTECYYPAKDIDKTYQFFPFEYPWTRLKNSTCIFQYSPFFSYLGTLISVLFNDFFVMYISILFCFFCMIVFDRILSLLDVKEPIIAISTILTFILSFPILTIIDFSEMSLFHFLVLGGLYISIKIYLAAEQKPLDGTIFRLLLFQSFLFGLSFLLRGEIVLLGGIFYAVNLIFFGFIFLKIRSIAFLAIGLSMPIIFYGIFHKLQMGNPLGYRLLSILDNSKHSMSVQEHITIGIGYLYGNKIMIGIFKAFPGLALSAFIFVPKIYREIPRYIKVLFAIGFSYIMIASFSITVYGGVGYFGLRYLEPGYIILLIVITYITSHSIHFSKNWKSVLLLFVMVLFMIRSIQFIKRGITHLHGASVFYHGLQSKFAKVGNSGYILHTSYNTSYLIGYSFLKQKHLIPYTLSDFENIEKQIYEKGEEIFIVVDTPKDHYVSADIPKEKYPKFKNRYKIEPKYFEVVGKENFLEYELYTLKRKK